MKKAVKSALSLMLALVLMVSVLAVGASAARPETVKRYKNYMSIGDSVGSGFGQPEYNKSGKMLPAEMLGQRVEDSYPDKVADFTGAKLTQRCLPGTTCASWRYWLDDTYSMTEWEWEELENFSFGFYTKDWMQNMKAPIRQAIREADLITVDIGLNDTWYPAIALVYYIAEDGTIGPFDPRETLEKELAKYGTWMTVARNAMYLFAGIAENPVKWGKYVTMLAEMLLNYWTSYANNYDAIIKNIFKLNPDVTVVAPGISNSFRYMSVFPGGLIYQLPLYDGAPIQLTVPYVGIVYIPNELTLTPSLAMVTGGLYDLAYTPARKYYTQAYPGQYFYVDCSKADLIGKNWTIPMYENSSLDDTGFNPHPTKAGHLYFAKQIVSVLPSDPSRPAKLTKGSEGWGVYNDDGSVDTTYTGLGKAKSTYYVKNGLMQTDYSGVVKIGSRYYYIKNGKWINTYNGTVKAKSGKTYRFTNGVAK